MIKQLYKELIWNRDTDVFASRSRKFLAKRPLKYNREEMITAIAKNIPHRKRSTYRKLVAALALLLKSAVFDKRGDVL